MGGALNHSFISTHFLLSTYSLDLHMRLLTRVYSILIALSNMSTVELNFDSGPSIRTMYTVMDIARGPNITLSIDNENV